MNDIDLLVFGCAVMFLAYAGAYVFIRERFLAQDEDAKRPVRVPTRQAVLAQRAARPRR
ncbi:MAG: hypothetical protein QNK04_19870 [Myxococcota bacterium]|nr:hypothetical protein [Myxococcota bacterium]